MHEAKQKDIQKVNKLNIKINCEYNLIIDWSNKYRISKSYALQIKIKKK